VRGDVQSSLEWFISTVESVANGIAYRQSAGASLLIPSNSYMLKARGAAREKSPKISDRDHPGSV
jgi:hypothetical protein